MGPKAFWRGFIGRNGILPQATPVIISALMRAKTFATNRVAAAFLVAAALVYPVFADDLALERRARIARLLQQYTDEGRIPGAVALVLRDGKPVYERAFGWSDKEAGRRMTTDTIFRIASQTKAVTTTAVLMLVEEGKIGINEPVSHFIPTFKETTVAVKDASGVKIVPAKRGDEVADGFVCRSCLLPQALALQSW